MPVAPCAEKKFNKGNPIMVVERLIAEDVYQACDLSRFTFNTSADLEPIEDLSEALCQPRAVESLRFGTGIRREGYNIFALGPPGTGRHSMVRQVMDRNFEDSETPDDWCYVNNFEDFTRPRALRIPAGKGSSFAKAMEKMVRDARNALKAAFESEEYQNRVHSIEQELKDRQGSAFEEINSRARDKGLTIIRTPNGIAFAPLKANGEVMPPDEYQQVPEEGRKYYDKVIEGLQAESQKVFQKIPHWQKEIREKVEKLNGEIAQYSISELIDEIRNEYTDVKGVGEHLDAVKKDITENLTMFISGGEQHQQTGGQMGRLLAQMQQQQPTSGEIDMNSPVLRRYKVNLIVDNSRRKGAPVIFDDNPTFASLVGKVEHLSQMGALITDFNLIKSGALHRANGGALVLDARKVLTQPGAWEGLKRALKSNRVKIESLAEMYSLLSTVMLDPEPIPLDVKVVLIGMPFVYYMLQELDPEFSELFKVAADFDVQMERNRGNQETYARLLGSIVSREKLLDFDKGAIGRLIEQSSRMAGDKERLNTRIRDIRDLMLEADYWARRNGGGPVTAEDVQKAIDSKIYRADRLRERVQEEIERGTLYIDTEGSQVGQVNGLSVIMLGDFAFGRPSRISARVQMGKGQVIDIEREAKLSGPIHSKGVLILSGFLGARYALDRPLSLNASLVFEQSYGGVEGDSASSAELYALISAISGIPVRQGFAVTGSVDQYGRIQAIGGVNEKIEGFYDVCRKKGLTGRQGVLIPATNVKHLMLRKDVVDAIREERFHVFPVETVDQGIELLTGMRAGEPDGENRFPDDTVNGSVQAKLRKFSENMQKFAKGTEAPGDERES